MNSSDIDNRFLYNLNSRNLFGGMDCDSYILKRFGVATQSPNSAILGNLSSLNLFELGKMVDCRTIIEIYRSSTSNSTKAANPCGFTGEYNIARIDRDAKTSMLASEFTLQSGSSNIGMKEQHCLLKLSPVDSSGEPPLGVSL